jgi:hypothetical protein
MDGSPMLAERLMAHRQYVNEEEAKTKERVAEAFAPLQQELRYHLAEAQRAQERARSIYPFNNYREPELAVGWILEELLEARVKQITRAIKHLQFEAVCKPPRIHTVSPWQLEEVCGTSDLTCEEIARLYRGSGAYFVAATGGLDELQFHVDRSMMDDDWYVTATAPTFPGDN